MNPSTATMGPGIGAFLAFFALAVALWLLMRNMNGRMRRMAYRERDRLAALEAQVAQEQAAKDAKKTNAEKQDRGAEVADPKDAGPAV